MNIQGKSEVMQYLQQQEQAMSQQQNESKMLEMAVADAQLKELYSKATSNIAMARERSSRSDSNVGLFEERLSELQKNQAISLREKMDALQKLVETIQKYGEVETFLRESQLDRIEDREDFQNDLEKREARQSSLANSFLTNIMSETNQIGQMAEQG